MNETIKGSLAGIKVIDFTHVLAGPACSYYLSLLGADVIKVESVKKGDAMRYRGGTSEPGNLVGMSTSFLTQAAGKRSIALDISSPKGFAIFEKLLKKADILVENHKPTTLNKLGINSDYISKVNDKLIHCALTGYGRKGDKENAAAYDVNIQAISGIMNLTGFEGQGPIRTGAPIIDYGVALAASFAISSALIDENRFSFTLNSLAKDKLGRTKNEDLLIAAAKEFGVDPKKEMYKLPSMHVGEYAEYDARLTYDLFLLNKEESFKVTTNSFTNLNDSLRLLDPKLRKKINIVYDLNQADYVLDNHMKKWSSTPGEENLQKDFSIFYNLIIDGNIINTVYKRN